MHPLIDFEKTQLKSKVPPFKSGDTVRVHCKIKEGDKERVQVFEGVVISRHNAGVRSSFTVRKVSFGIGVERVFPLHAPFVEKIEVAMVGRVRRSKLYYLRELSGKKARIRALDTRGAQEEAEAVPPDESEAQATEVSQEEVKAESSSEPKEGKPETSSQEEKKETPSKESPPQK